MNITGGWMRVVSRETTLLNVLLHSVSTLLHLGPADNVTTKILTASQCMSTSLKLWKDHWISDRKSCAFSIWYTRGLDGVKINT